MDLRTLKYFVCIVEEQTIKKASVKLNIAQPALSIELKKLESELGVLLFERKNRGLSITKEGRILYQKALNLLQDASNIKKEIRQSSQKIIRIGVMSSAYGIYMSDLLSFFISSHKDISFDITEETTYELLGHLLNNDIELAFVRTPFNNFNLECLEFESESMVAVGKREYFLNDNNLISIKELSGKPLIFYKRYQILLEEAFAQKDETLNFLCKCEDAKTAILWANQGLGVAIVPESAVKLASRDVVIKTIDSKMLKTTPMIIYKSYDTLSLEARSLVDAYKSKSKLL